MANTTSPQQLFLLADHLKLSLLERQRAIALKLEPGNQDAQITKSLSSLHQGLGELEQQYTDNEQPEEPSSDLTRLRKQYADLYKQFHGIAPPSSSSNHPNEPALSADFEAAQSRPNQARRKSVRFRDEPGETEEDPQETANRAALFSTDQQQDRYSDEEPTDQTDLSNQQIHAYHKQVLRDQDEQLDTLGQSIGRQRLLGIQMGNEMDEQNVLLEDVEAGVDRHQSTLDRARARLGNVARKSKGNWSWITIGILVVVLVLLIAVLK